MIAYKGVETRIIILATIKNADCLTEASYNKNVLIFKILSFTNEVSEQNE